MSIAGPSRDESLSNLTALLGITLHDVNNSINKDRIVWWFCREWMSAFNWRAIKWVWLGGLPWTFHYQRSWQCSKSKQMAALDQMFLLPPSFSQRMQNAWSNRPMKHILYHEPSNRHWLNSHIDMILIPSALVAYWRWSAFPLFSLHQSRKKNDLIIHHDAQFVGRTVAHFLVRNNSFNISIMERMVIVHICFHIHTYTSLNA